MTDSQSRAQKGMGGPYAQEHAFCLIGRLWFCSGHRIGTAEVESALVSHSMCAEAAVVGYDHEVRKRLLVRLLFGSDDVTLA